MNWLPRPIYVNEDVCEDDELSHKSRIAFALMILPLSIMAGASSSVGSRISISSASPSSSSPPPVREERELFSNASRVHVSFEDAARISHQKFGSFPSFLGDSAFGVLAFELFGTDFDQAFMAEFQKKRAGETDAR